MKLKQLEIALQRLTGFSDPQAAREQYPTPAPLAARLLYHALMRGDIKGKTVCDPGSGTGVLAIGAALLGANDVVGIEIDPLAAKIAADNAKLLGTEVEFVVADICAPTLARKIGERDVVVMNPPFGAQRLHADRPFIDFALQTAPVTYGVFNAGTRRFIQTYIQTRATIDEVVGGRLPIWRTFSFHTRDIEEIDVEILRLIRNA